MSLEHFELATKNNVPLTGVKVRLSDTDDPSTELGVIWGTHAGHKEDSERLYDFWVAEQPALRFEFCRIVSLEEFRRQELVVS